MDKKKKQQLIILGVLGVVVIIVALVNLGVFNPPPAAPPPDPNAGTPGPGGPGGPGPAGPGGPGGPAGTGTPKPEDDLAPVDTTPPTFVTVSFSPGNFDPLKVLNSDIVDERRAEEVETLRKDWVLKGITSRMYPLKDEDGQLVFDEDGRVKEVEVFEAFFDGKAYPYKVGDRLLPGTRFKITKIFHNRDGASVEVTSDTGAVQKLKIASFDPYPESK